MTPAESARVRVLATELPFPFTRFGCRKCMGEEGYLAQYIQARGRRQLRWVCGACGDHFTVGDLPQSLLARFNVRLEDLPVCQDKRWEHEANAPFDQWRCVVCEERGADGHHWAPRSIFPHWPFNLVQPLCELHHREWHDTMRAHGLRYPHELAADAA